MIQAVLDPHALMLARIQFACNITFHILFPSITIGLSWILLYLKIKPNTAKNFDKNYQFWIKVFALSFALGAVSGVTMSFQFGTNWPKFMQTVGNIAGPLLAYEVMTAFFLEATFLGIMLFAYDRVPRWVHLLSTAAVAVGTTLSAFWIISLNAWMHTPSGFHMDNGVAIVDSWWSVIFNPSMPYRFTHTLLASLLTAAFLMMGLSALRLLKYPKDLASSMILKQMTTLGAVCIFLQIIIGDMHGLNTLKHHPETIAAMEGLWNTTEGAPLVLLANIDEKQHTNTWALEIPKLSSVILTHSLHGTVKGLNDFEIHPPVTPVFWSFRLMVGTGGLMALLSWIGVVHLRKSRRIHPWYLKSCVIMTFSGWVATLAGWYLTEIGRQPYLVSGLLRTKDAAGAVDAKTIALSLTLYSILYVVLLMLFMSTLVYLARKPERTS